MTPTPIKLFVPLTSIQIDGDRQLAQITLPNGQDVLEGVLMALTNPESVVVVNNEEPEEGAQKAPESEEVPVLEWRPAQGRCCVCERMQDVRNKGWGADELLCDGKCDGLTDDEGAEE